MLPRRRGRQGGGEGVLKGVRAESGPSGGTPLRDAGSWAESRSSRLHTRQWGGREAGVCVSGLGSPPPGGRQLQPWAGGSTADFLVGVATLSPESPLLDDTVLFGNGICFRPPNAATSGVGCGEYLDEAV